MFEKRWASPSAERRRIPESSQALHIIATNIDMAAQDEGPICQDTGMPTFDVHTPVGVNQIELRKAIRAAVAEATKRGKLRPNSVDSLTGKNSGDNLSEETPIIHFEQWEKDQIEVKLILKGGGCVRDLKPDILTCTPSYAVRLGEALSRGRRRAGRRTVVEGRHSSVPSRGRRRCGCGSRTCSASVHWTSTAYRRSSAHGIAAECIVAADGLHVNEDHFLVEALDPLTGLPVPDGTLGELTFTTMTKQALPLLRYRTGDIASLRRGICRCGRTLVKMSKIIGRKDDMLVVRGVNVYPSEVERVLLEEDSMAPDYLLVVDERDAQPRADCPLRDRATVVLPRCRTSVRSSRGSRTCSGSRSPSG